MCQRYKPLVSLATSGIASNQARLAALNHERAAEEAAGHISWLRPDYQIPRFRKKDAVTK